MDRAGDRWRGEVDRSAAPDGGARMKCRRRHSAVHAFVVPWRAFDLLRHELAVTHWSDRAGRNAASRSLLRAMCSFGTPKEIDCAVLFPLANSRLVLLENAAGNMIARDGLRTPEHRLLAEYFGIQAPKRRAARQRTAPNTLARASRKQP
ncbi:MAG TPA: hypothetical protein VEL07_19825 [Planctomycetota bacterium]|nr:hypothetical protein [Planctomycetota bacterium]